MILLILLVLLVLLIVGAAPVFPYNQNWQYGWGPAGFLVLVLLIAMLLYFFVVVPSHLR